MTGEPYLLRESDVDVEKKSLNKNPFPIAAFGSNYLNVNSVTLIRNGFTKVRNRLYKFLRGCVEL